MPAQQIPKIFNDLGLHDTGIDSPDIRYLVQCRINIARADRTA
jgi:hypothetical protein